MEDAMRVVPQVERQLRLNQPRYINVYMCMVINDTYFSLPTIPKKKHKYI